VGVSGGGGLGVEREERTGCAEKSFRGGWMKTEAQTVAVSYDGLVSFFCCSCGRGGGAYDPDA